MKRWRITLILSSFLVISGAIASSQFSASTGLVRGQIVDMTVFLPDQNRTAGRIPGVRVIFRGADGTEYETTTDSLGEYEIAGLPPGRYLISVYKDGYADRGSRSVTVIAGGDHYVALKMRKLNVNPLSAVIKALSDEDGEVRRSACQTLAAVGEPAVPALIKRLTDENEGVRWTAAYALKKIGTAEAMKAVEEFRREREK